MWRFGAFYSRSIAYMCKTASAQTTSTAWSYSTSWKLLVSPRRHRQKHHPSHKLLHRAKTPPPQVPIYTPDLSPRGSSGTLTCLKRKYATMMTVEPRKDREAQACATRMIACCFAYGIPAVSVSRSPMLSSPVQPCSLNLRPSLLFIYGQRSGCTHTNTRTHTQGCGGSQGFVAW